MLGGSEAWSAASASESGLGSMLVRGTLSTALSFPWEQLRVISLLDE